MTRFHSQQNWASTRIRNTKNLIFYVGYLLAVTSILLLFLEGAGRLLIHFKYGIPGKIYGLWQYDPELGANHRPNSYNRLTSTNAYGFRNREDVLDPKPVNSLRIIAFGGSTTFGHNLSDDETYTHQLELKLRSLPGYEKTQVLNAGRISFSTGHNLILMKRLVPKLNPDYVILYEGVNEIFNSWIIQRDGISLDQLDKDGKYEILGKKFDQNRWLKRNSVTIRFIDYIVKRRLIDPAIQKRWGNDKHAERPIHPWIIKNYKNILTQMLDYLHKQHVIPIVVRYASVNGRHQRIFSNLSAEVAHEKGALVYDMQNNFEKYGDEMKSLFIKSGIHVTPEGAQLLANGLFDLINASLPQNHSYSKFKTIPGNSSTD